MRRTGLIAAGIAMFAGFAFADSPKDIRMQFDPASRMFTVSIVHGSQNIGKHYIKLVTVNINGQPAVVQNCRTQTGKDGQNVMYVLPEVKAGDTVEVSGTCSIMGSLKKSLILK